MDDDQVQALLVRQLFQLRGRFFDDPQLQQRVALPAQADQVGQDDAALYGGDADIQFSARHAGYGADVLLQPLVPLFDPVGRFQVGLAEVCQLHRVSGADEEFRAILLLDPLEGLAQGGL